MRKNLLKPLLLLVAGAMMGMGAHANELLVCDGTTTNNFVPIHSTYYDTEGTTTQMIFPADMLSAMNGQKINSVTFYTNNDGILFGGGLLQVSIGETDQTEFESSTGYITGLTVVKTAPVTQGPTEITFEFDSPYTYGGGNLVIENKVITAGSWKYTYFLGETQSGNTALSRNTLYKFLPKTLFDYGDPLPYAANVTPTELDFGTIRVGNSVEMSVTLTNNGLNAFTPAIGALQAPFSTVYTPAELATSESVEIPVVFTPSQAGNFAGTLTVDCGEAGTFEVDLTAVAKEAADDITVCEGTLTSSYLPLYGLNYDIAKSTCQMIYPAEMLNDIINKDIVEITFYPNKAMALIGGNLQLSLKETEQAEFSNARAAAVVDPVTDMTLVAERALESGITELRFELTEPFTYNGGNLAIQTYVETPGNYSTTYFYGQSQSVNCSFANWNTNYELVGFLPQATFTVRKSQTTAIDNVDMQRTVKSVRYVNLAGMSGTQPFEGLNIVVTQYSDGTVSTAKVIK